jgi:hypothetical protein
MNPVIVTSLILGIALKGNHNYDLIIFRLDGISILILIFWKLQEYCGIREC